MRMLCCAGKKIIKIYYNRDTVQKNERNFNRIQIKNSWSNQCRTKLGCWYEEILLRYFVCFL